jgi:hypothetical protein
MPLTKEEYLARLQQTARERVGQCLAPTYINSTTKLPFVRALGHEWLGVPNSIQRGIWCPKCGRTRRTIEDVKAFALKKGGKVIFEHFEHSHSLMAFECSNGNHFALREAG